VTAAVEDPEVGDGDPHVVTRALKRFLLWSVVTMVALIVGIVVVGQSVARSQALDEARSRARTLAADLVAPEVDRAVREREPGAMDGIEDVLDTRLRDGTLEHVKLWDQDGRIIWADQTELVGERYTLSDDVVSLFGTERVTAELSDLGRPENVGERDEGELLEVYVGSRDADGVPLVFEAYMPTDRIEGTESAIIRGVLPISIGALGMFQIAMLPIALSLARRVQRSETARTRMTAHALRASELERQRIAQELHDGVVQDLAGVGFSIPAIARELPGSARGQDARQLLLQVGDIVHRDVAALRTMMIEVYPPDLADTGLLLALQELAKRTEARDIAVSLDVSPETAVDLPLPMARLVYRVVREGLHNVAKHSEGDEAVVRVHRRGGQLQVVVEDNGRGLGIGGGAAADGHIGLRLLREAVEDAGGDLTLRSGIEPLQTGAGGDEPMEQHSDPTRPGTRLVARLPVRDA
jgi:signal transduction histidine kinase